MDCSAAVSKVSSCYHSMRANPRRPSVYLNFHVASADVQVIVKQESAVLGIERNKRGIPLDGDHLEITKFSSQEDGNYTLVAGHLREIIEEILEERISEITNM